MPSTQTPALPLDQLPYAELRELREAVYRGVMRLYDYANVIHTGMSQMSTWTPEYAATRARGQAVMAAAREQSELSAEIAAEMRSRWTDVEDNG
jgi:hypothetical protein